MKKILTIILILIMAFSVMTACGGRSKSDNSAGAEGDVSQMLKDLIDGAGLGTEDQRDSAKEIIDMESADKSVWPADKLSVALPEYPNGTFSVMNDGNGLMIGNTDEETMKAYADVLSEDGWEVEDIAPDMGIIVYDATKGGWTLRFQQSMADGRANIVLMKDDE